MIQFNTHQSSEHFDVCKLYQLSTIILKFWTFVGEPAFSKPVQQFHRALTEPYSQLWGKHLYDPAEMEAFCDQHAPRLFGQLNNIVNDEKEKPSKKHLKIQKTRVVSMLHNPIFVFCNQVQVIYICYFRSY